MKRAGRLGIGFAFALGLCAASAHSQERTPRERFARAVELAAEGDYRTALHEFRAVFEITRNPEVLFNIAAAHEQLNQYAEAVEAVERYERLAPPTAVARHREDLAAAMMRLASRVGTLQLSASPADARCTVDGAERARDALSSGVRVSIGPRAVRCEAPGHVPVERAVEVAPGATARVALTLSRAQARVTVSADRDGAEVIVDGRSRGLTPLPEALQVDEGRHRVRVAHPGYVPVEVEVDARGDGARVDAALRWQDPVPPEVAARLRVRASEDGATLSLDGHPITGDASMRLPPGHHRLGVTRENFLPVERAVELRAGTTHEEDVALRPAPTYRADYTARARRQRLAWQLVAGGGGLLTAVGAALFAVTLPPVLDANAEGDRLAAQSAECRNSTTMNCPTGESQRLTDLATVQYDRRDSGLPAVIAGAALLGGGVATLIVAAFMASSADPVDRFSRPPTFRVAMQPGGAGFSVAW